MSKKLISSSSELDYHEVFQGLIIVASVTLLLVFTYPYTASNFDIVPDSFEYAFGGLKLSQAEPYALLLENTYHPPRYAPWFSLLALAPVYKLFGPELGNAIIPVTLFSVIGSALSFCLGYRFFGIFGGIFAAALLVIIPEYRYYSSNVLTDIPAAVLYLNLLIGAVLIFEKKDKASSICVALGLCIGFAVAFRIVNLLLLAPVTLALLIKCSSKSLVKILGLVLPALLALLATLIYNFQTFDSPFRTGYHYWTAVPYDYLNLLLSPKYVLNNLNQITFGTLLVPVVLITISVPIINHGFERELGRKFIDKNDFKKILTILLFLSIPLLIFYVFYFYTSSRFYLPIFVVFASFSGAVFGGLIDKLVKSSGYKTIAVFLLIAYLGLVYFSTGNSSSYKRKLIDHIDDKVPAGSLVISNHNPAYMYFSLAKHSDIQYMPRSRSAEYASKIVVKTRIDNPSPYPEKYNDHRSSGLIDSGAEEAIVKVAKERMSEIKEIINSGKRVFLDASLLPDKEFDYFKNNFVISKYSDYLIELK